MVELNNGSAAGKMKVCVMRHGETSFIQEYMERINARKAAGISNKDLTPEQIKQREIDYNEHSMQAKFIDDDLTEAGKEMCLAAFA